MTATETLNIGASSSADTSQGENVQGAEAIVVHLTSGDADASDVDAQLLGKMESGDTLGPVNGYSVTGLDLTADDHVIIWEVDGCLVQADLRLTTGVASQTDVDATWDGRSPN